MFKYTCQSFIDKWQVGRQHKVHPCTYRDLTPAYFQGTWAIALILEKCDVLLRVIVLLLSYCFTCVGIPTHMKYNAIFFQFYKNGSARLKQMLYRWEDNMQQNIKCLHVRTGSWRRPISKEHEQEHKSWKTVKSFWRWSTASQWPNWFGARQLKNVGHTAAGFCPSIHIADWLCKNYTSCTV